MRKVPGIGPRLELGGDPALTMRLRLLEDDPVEIATAGDPSQAPPRLAPLATLLADLLAFDHPSLRPYNPSGYAMVVREGRLVGGCRAWGFTFPIAAALASPRAVSAAEARAGRPAPCRPPSAPPTRTPRTPRASATSVTLRPLLPGELP